MRWLILLCLGAAGCGDPLVEAKFLGTPQFAVEGAVVQMSARVPASHGTVRSSLFWIGPDEAYRPAPSVEQRVELDAALAAFRATLFDAPPEPATTFSDLLESGRLGLAMLVLYADQDDDGALDLEQDLLLGASSQHLIGWVSIPVPEDAKAAELVGTAAAGYHLFEYDVESRCPFVMAAQCEGEGGLVEVPPSTEVALTLWEDPADVLVPAPFLDRMQTVPGSIWGGR